MSEIRATHEKGPTLCGCIRCVPQCREHVRNRAKLCQVKEADTEGTPKDGEGGQDEADEGSVSS